MFLYVKTLANLDTLKIILFDNLIQLRCIFVSSNFLTYLPDAPFGPMNLLPTLVPLKRPIEFNWAGFCVQGYGVFVESPRSTCQRLCPLKKSDSLSSTKRSLLTFVSSTRDGALHAPPPPSRNADTLGHAGTRSGDESWTQWPLLCWEDEATETFSLLLSSYSLSAHLPGCSLTLGQTAVQYGCPV